MTSLGFVLSNCPAIALIVVLAELGSCAKASPALRDNADVPNEGTPGKLQHARDPSHTHSASEEREKAVKRCRAVLLQAADSDRRAGRRQIHHGKQDSKPYSDRWCLR